MQLRVNTLFVSVNIDPNTYIITVVFIQQKHDATECKHPVCIGQYRPKHIYYNRRVYTGL